MVRLLASGSTINFSTPEFGPNEVPVSQNGGLDDEYGFQSTSIRFEGVTTISARTAEGSILTGDVTFD